MTKTALITGSTSGIGKAFADKLASEGYNLILVSRDLQKLSEQAKAFAAQRDIKVEYIAFDLIESGAAQKVFDTVHKLGLSVDILINNAGFNEADCFLNTDINKELGMIELHIRFTTQLIKLFLPQMVEQGYGKILNVGSTGSYIACPNDAVYAATKAYILHFSNALYYELKGTGVSVTTLCPGSTKTEFAKKANMESTLLFKIFIMGANKVADIGYKVLLKNKRVIVPGIYNKLLIASAKFLPIGLISYITKFMLNKKPTNAI